MLTSACSHLSRNVTAPSTPLELILRDRGQPWLRHWIYFILTGLSGSAKDPLNLHPGHLHPLRCHPLKPHILFSSLFPVFPLQGTLALETMILLSFLGERGKKNKKHSKCEQPFLFTEYTLPALTDWIKWITENETHPERGWSQWKFAGTQIQCFSDLN